MENLALKRFMERRLTPNSVPAPQPPEGRENHAPLEMLSSLALKQMRLKSSQNLASLPDLSKFSAPAYTPTTSAEYKATAVRLSPVSLLPFEADRYPFQHLPLHARESQTFGDGGARGDHNNRQRKRAANSETSSDQNDISITPSLAEGGISQGRISKSRCQSSKFCHICMYQLPIQVLIAAAYKKVSKS
jgi:hypothetical protein